MGATEDAAARSVIAGQKPEGIAGWGTSSGFFSDRVRRAFRALVVLGWLLVAPHAAAECADATPTTGAAPLTATFTTCDATAHWDFGDGTSAEGQTVQHTYAVGLWIA